MSRDQRPRFPPSLSRVSTELDRLYDKEGGPLPLAQKSKFILPCNSFTRNIVEPLLSQHCRDSKKVYRLWPWVAFAADQYRFEQEERTKQLEKTEPTPTEIVGMVDAIGRAAKALVMSINRLQKLAYRLDDPTAPSRRPHLAYIDEMLTQATAGLTPGDVEDNDVAQAVAHFGRISFLKRVECVRATADKAKSLISTDLLKRSSAQPKDVALVNLAVRIGRIWIELTGKKPNANPSQGNPRPPFVRLVAAVVKMAGGPEPNAWQVKNALAQGDGEKHKRRIPRKR